MIQLSSVIQELFEVANVQLDILSRIKGDSRISEENKNIATEALNYKILSISDLLTTTLTLLVIMIFLYLFLKFLITRTLTIY